MFATSQSRRRQAEQIAGQAWENLTTAIDAAGSSTRSARRRAADKYEETSHRLGSGAKEASHRAKAAYDALAGRRAPTPWGTLAVATLAGAALGWVVTVFGRGIASQVDRAIHPETTTLEDLISSR